MKDESKKVIICGNFSFPNYNAAGKRVVGLGYLFSNLGYQTSFLGFCNGQFENLEKHFYSFSSMSKLKRVFSSSKYFKEFLNVARLEGLGAGDIVLLYGTPSVAFFAKKVIRHCRKKGMLVIFDCVDWIEKISTNPIINFIKTIDNRYLKSKLALKCSGVICISSFLFEKYTNKHLKCIIIPPIFKRFFENDRKICKSSDDFVRFLYIGIPFSPSVKRKEDFKDRIDLCVESVALLTSKYIFDIYGITEKEYLSKVPSHKRLIESSNIVFHGKCESNAVDGIYASADYTLLIRDDNIVSNAGFPTKVAESIIHGIPVITNSTSDMNKYLNSNKDCYLLSSNDTSKLSLIEGLNNRDKISFMKSECIKNGSFEFETYITVLEKFINEL